MEVSWGNEFINCLMTSTYVVNTIKKKNKILDWILAENLYMKVGSWTIFIWRIFEKEKKSISFDIITCSIILFHDSQTHGHKITWNATENGIYGHQPWRILFAKLKRNFVIWTCKTPKWNFAPMAHKNCASR